MKARGRSAGKGTGGGLLKGPSSSSLSSPPPVVGTRSGLLPSLSLTEAKLGNAKSVADLEEELSEANRELQAREDYLLGVQRNYDALAKLCNKNIKVIDDRNAQLEDSLNQLQRLEAEEGQFDERKEQMLQLQAANDAFKQRQLDSDEQNNKLTQKCYEYRTHIADLNEIKEELAGQHTHLQGVAQTSKDEVAELKEQLRKQEMKTRLDAAMEQNVELRASLGEVTAQLEFANELQKRTSVLYQKSQNMLRRMEMDKANSATDNTRLRDSHSKAQKQLSCLQAEMEEERRKNESLLLDTHALQSQIKMLSRSAPELKEKLEFSEKARKVLQEQFDAIYAERANTDELLREATEQMSLLKKQLAEQVRARQKDKEYYEKVSGNSVKGKDELVQGNYELNSRAKDLASLNNDLTQQLEDMTQKNQALRKNKEFMQEQIESYEKQLQGKVQHTDDEGDEGDEPTPQQPEPQGPAPVEDSADSGPASSAALERHKNKIKELEVLTKDQKNRIAVLQAKLTKAQRETERGQRDLENAREKHQKSKEEFAKRAREELSTRLKGLQEQMSEINARLVAEQHKSAELLALLDSSPGSSTPLDAATLDKRDKELKATVAKLVVSEEATEASFTCIQCVRLYENAVTCIPCGHSYCKSCVENKGYCSQCGPTVTVSYYPNELLEDLTAKYTFRKSALAGLKGLLAFQ